MPKNALVRKTSRIAGSAVVLGATAALLLLGAPADAAAVGGAGRGIATTLGRGI